MQGNTSKDHSTVDHYIMKGPLVNPVMIMLILDKLGWWRSSINLKPNPLLQNWASMDHGSSVTPNSKLVRIFSTAPPVCCHSFNYCTEVWILSILDCQRHGSKQHKPVPAFLTRLRSAISDCSFSLRDVLDHVVHARDAELPLIWWQWLKTVTEIDCQ